MTRPDPALVAECFAENRSRLIALAQEISRHTASLNLSRKEAPNAQDHARR
jgi:hypothetical protein